MKKRNAIERFFEFLLWKSRLVVITAVVFSMLGAFVMFVVASIDIWHTVVNSIGFYLNPSITSSEFHSTLISRIIGAVDLYLIAVVMLIFSFGIYELFVSDIDDALDTKVGNRILSIHSLDELKDKLGKVVVMVLIVSFFKRVIHMRFADPVQMLYFAVSILVLSLSLYFMHKKNKPN